MHVSAGPVTIAVSIQNNIVDIVCHELNDASSDRIPRHITLGSEFRRKITSDYELFKRMNLLWCILLSKDGNGWNLSKLYSYIASSVRMRFSIRNFQGK